MTKAAELTDASINFISFVKKGANGDPIRLLKAADGQGLDLASLNAVIASAKQAAPVFVAVAKGADLEALSLLLKDSGFDMARKTDGGNVTVFMQGDYANIPATTRLVQVAKDIVLGVDGVQKADFYEADGTSFNDMLGAMGALPMMDTAVDILRSVLFNALWSATTVEELKTLVSQAVSDFGTYSEKLITMIPLTVFKAEQIVLKSAVTASKTDEPTADPAVEEPTAADPDKPVTEPVANPEADPAAVAADPVTEQKATDDKDKDPAAADADPATATDTADPAVAETAQKGAGAVDADAIVQAVAKMVGEQLAPIQAAVQAVTERVAKAEGSLQSTVIGGRSGDEPTRTVKGDQPANGSDDFSFDTGQGRKP